MLDWKYWRYWRYLRGIEVLEVLEVLGVFERDLDHILLIVVRLFESKDFANCNFFFPPPKKKYKKYKK